MIIESWKKSINLIVVIMKDRILVERSNSDESRARVVEKIVQRQEEIAESRKNLVSSPPLLIFPEGTTTNGKVMLPFKKDFFSFFSWRGICFSQTGCSRCCGLRDTEKWKSWIRIYLGLSTRLDSPNDDSIFEFRNRPNFFTYSLRAFEKRNDSERASSGVCRSNSGFFLHCYRNADRGRWFSGQTGT